MTEKKKFYLMITGILLSITMIVTTTLIIPPDGNSYNMVYVDKIEILKNTEGNRIILVGGSNVAFGVNSEQIEKELSNKFNVINMGLHAGIGLIDMLQDIESYGQKGDIVVVMPEYSHFYGDSAYGGEIFWEIATIRGLCNSRNFYYLNKRIDSLGQYSINKIKETVYRVIKEKTNIVKKFTYDKSIFNYRGDVTGHYLFPSKKNIDIMSVNGVLNKKVINIIKNTNNNLKSKGIKVIYLPPVFQKTSASKSLEKIIELESILKENGFGFEVPAEAYFYDDNLFFDTVYHLNKEGINMRSKQLANDLIEILDIKKN